MKEAIATRPIHELIRKRWSPRAFTKQAVPQEALEQVFEAASWAFSAMNEQPWRYIYAHKEDTEAFNRILSCLVPANQLWAKDAPVLIISLAKTHFDNGQPNRTAMHDVGAANATLFLEATALGLHGHVLGGFDYAKTREEFALPAHLDPVAFIALGYVGAAEQLEEPFRSRETAPRSRKPVADFAFNHELPE
ncbi:nitroreductase family protein [Hymenobacter busanensis]|uniref:Nitroreductase family protein n=1 Tax=Hymenobacter busanensis TaxID=2607656 RepID=A0A7L4ZXQ5_9BACT|nr:nitroreductase family protein [Hymenobacter busanensis]KAA9332046.1 nitroreductase family protein [Hymenobacter busanensis]QHJ07616.1 nitroreductase [Hymenobacter busanensis]